MKRLLPLVTLVLFVLPSASTVACLNDQDTEPFEQRYQEQYEPAEPVEPVVLATKTDVAAKPAVAGIGIGATLLLASGLLSLVGRRRQS